MHLLLACCILIGLTAGEVIDLKHACQEMREILMCDGQGDTKYTYAYSSRNDIINRLVFSGLVDGLIDLENLPSVETVSALSSKLNCENLKGLGHDVMIYDSSSEIHCSHVTEVTTTSAAVAVTTNPHVITVEEHTTNHDSAINHEPTSEILPNQTIKVLHSLTSSSSKPPATSNPSTTPDSFQTAPIIIIITLSVIIAGIIIILVIVKACKRRGRMRRKSAMELPTYETSSFIEVPTNTPSAEIVGADANILVSADSVDSIVELFAFSAPTPKSLLCTHRSKQE